MSDLTGLTIAVLGGTGPQGRGLARRFAAAGLRVVAGSRTAEKAQATAAELVALTDGFVTGSDTAGAAAAGDVVLVVVPWDAHAELLKELAPDLPAHGVVDCVNPPGFHNTGSTALPLKGGEGP